MGSGEVGVRQVMPYDSRSCIVTSSPELPQAHLCIVSRLYLPAHPTLDQLEIISCDHPRTGKPLGDSQYAHTGYKTESTIGMRGIGSGVSASGTFLVYRNKLTITKTMHNIAGSTNALTNVMAIEAKRSTVATTRTGLNIVLSCFEKPTRKPVPTSDRIPPTAKSAKLVS